MRDYISRDDAIDSIVECIEARLDWRANESEEIQGLNVALCCVYDVPTADVAEVVRCKDCYAYRRDREIAEKLDLDPDYYCALNRSEFYPNGFCSWGMRPGQWKEIDK